MKIISHRGNIRGPRPDRENAPSYIDCAIKLGLEVEIDLRYMEEKYFLGHDTPDYEVSERWLRERKDSLWIHCKNLSASNRLQELDMGALFFCHTSDPYILTSNGCLWVHDLSSDLTSRCIVPLMDKGSLEKFRGPSTYAICTDEVEFGKYILRAKGLF